MYNASEAVKAGAAYLDIQRPGWAEKVDLATFQIGSSTACVIGQVYGDFDECFATLGLTDAQIDAYGFDVDEELSYRDRIARQCSLQKAWLAAIALRQFDATASVARGAIFLDQHSPGWAFRIDLDSFNLSSCHLCILGQIYGEFNSGLRSLGICSWDGNNNAADLGLVCRYSSTINNLSCQNHAALTPHWLAAIESRRTPAGRVAAGAAFLDWRVPDWDLLIDRDLLSMSNHDLCIMGQLFGDLRLGYSILGLDDIAAFRLGFERDFKNVNPAGDAQFGELTVLWRDLLLKRYWARRVAAEAVRLDRLAPTWYTRVDFDKFCVADPWRCPLACAFGDFYVGIFAVEMDLCCDQQDFLRPYQSMTRDDHGLDAAWLTEIKERKNA